MKIKPKCIMVYPTTFLIEKAIRYVLCSLARAIPMINLYFIILQH